MSEIPQREVVIASNNPNQIKRIRRALEPLLKQNGEKNIKWYELDTIKDTLETLKDLEHSLTPLVVMAGFEGEWFKILDAAEEIALDQIVTIMMSGSPADVKGAGEYNIHAVTTVLSETEMSRLVWSLLFSDVTGDQIQDMRGANSTTFNQGKAGDNINQLSQFRDEPESLPEDEFDQSPTGEYIDNP